MDPPSSISEVEADDINGLLVVELATRFVLEAGDDGGGGGGGGDDG